MILILTIFQKPESAHSLEKSRKIVTIVIYGFW